MPAFIDLSGKTFGRLFVIARTKDHFLPTGKPRTMYLCRCDCGTETSVSVGSLRTGTTQSCGCQREEKKRKHGMWRSPEFKVWGGMKERCLNPNNRKYPEYGGRGIRVCDRWLHSFATFYDDVGPRPSPEHSIDRIDANGNYEPGNVRWATDQQQNRNRRGLRMVTLGGQTMTLAEACERTGVPYHRAHQRLRKGWAEERALSG